MNIFGEWLFLLWTIKASYALSIDHICTRTENYTITSMETYVQPVVVNTYTWCLQVPPRCPRMRTEMRQRYRIKSEVKTRKVKECCEGYKRLEIRDKKDGDASCVPFCENCLAGVCVSPNKCQCDPGYQGTDCSKECPPGSWGVQCMEKCECAENVICDSKNGTCRCPPGFWGPRCEKNCPPQRWGRGCENFCNCKGHINYCHPETGHCTFTFTNIHSTSETTNAVRLFSTKIIEFEKGTTDLSWTTERIVEEEEKEELRNDLPLKTDYVKTIHKEDVTPAASIPLDVALIIIASIVFLSLMSIAIVTIIHTRTKLFETVRLSIYNDEKEKNNECESKRQRPPGRISTIIDSALPQIPVRTNPDFFSNPEQIGTILPASINIEPVSSYSNGTATIGLRISGHLRELLQEDHYDRPPTTLLRLHTDFESNGEHLYDEIPLQSTGFCERKST
ncbi:multiple epidermal growth factor-like domains protein 10 isoform X3 [Vespula pensylvanica]|uniref:multiple epidermal growth factor-like domains protein 10 isoform X3 n=1 Tax=Vespula pensylvanica TaxID=30213 RepID=UPI001CB9DF17|nr:multiple epidermal growth factor-like domains protein 10 isoform X3 [Vespula pensylvanica]